MSAKQKSLVGKFVLTTFLFGALFMSAHILIPPGAEKNLFQPYALYAIGGSVAVYFFYFRNEIREADFKGDGKYYLPHAWFVGMLLTPVGFVYIADSLSKLEDALIGIGIFTGLYLTNVLVFWVMVKNGNEDWKLSDGDD